MEHDAQPVAGQDTSIRHGGGGSRPRRAPDLPQLRPGRHRATITALAETGGARSLNAAVDNQGTLSVSPGSASTLSIIGSLSSSGAITLDLGGLAAGTGYDQIVVTGPLTINGTLNVGLFGAFVPVSTNSFTILTSTGARTGAFATPNLAVPLGANPLYGANSVTVSVP